MFGLNFIIAIVEENYAEMMEQRNKYIYRSKAYLNHECAQLLKHLTPMEPYRVIVFARRCLSSASAEGGGDKEEFLGRTDKFQSMFNDFFDVCGTKE